ncbi:MAG: methylated-DNA--[protein]-cysteine S-methyltransferase [Proteobacteria bacterium]|nr:MAG: methylated-DNA--[protein]-cysteine S-methyltransferase [Pseudomonadota bacterium]
MGDSKVYFRLYNSPVGVIYIYATDEKLIALTFERNDGEVVERLGIKEKTSDHSPIAEATVKQLKEYFAGKRKVFQIPMRLEGTFFQIMAWEYLKKVPSGLVLSYSEQARNMLRPNATRAVGAANAKNPISIIIPCHRVIGADGTITGYSGGTWVKRKLLEIEGYRFSPKTILRDEMREARKKERNVDIFANAEARLD